MLKSWLLALGAQVIECRDGREALQQFAELAPDWVVMDLEMPRLDGLSATRQLTTTCPKARVIILTQHDDDDSREAAREEGAYEFVPKDKLELLPAILFPRNPNTPNL